MTNEELREYEECGLVMTAQRERIEELEAALAEAREDTARLDWLESKGLTTNHNEDGRTRDYGVHSWEDRDAKKRMWTARYISSELPTLRAAIDAARKERP